MLRYFTERVDSKAVEFTRSRPYKKNDNAHVEQKNWTHVRQVFGYNRFDNSKLVGLMNEIYSNELSLLSNFFYPSVKLLEKKRIQSKIHKKHDIPKTPFQRLIETASLTKEQEEILYTKLSTLDPFLLQKRVQQKLKPIFALVNMKSRQKRDAI